MDRYLLKSEEFKSRKGYDKAIESISGLLNTAAGERIFKGGRTLMGFFHVEAGDDTIRKIRDQVAAEISLEMTAEEYGVRASMGPRRPRHENQYTYISDL